MSYTLYKAPRPHLMTSHSITYDITCTVFMTSLALYLKWHPPYLCHHSDSIDGLRPTVCMTSHPPYVCHLMHSPQRHIHSLWLHTIVVITLHPLHSWHHTHYIWHYTMAIQTLYLMAQIFLASTGTAPWRGRLPQVCADMPVPLTGSARLGRLPWA